jgi:hypothetical protein
MAHVGQGTWAAFKRAVASLSPEDSGTRVEARRMRTRFSDLGFAEFFVEGTERWRAFQPILTASPHQPNEAFLAGVRTARLMDRLRDSAERLRCQLFELVVDGLFTTVKIHGSPLANVARAAGVEFEPNVGRRLANALVPLNTTIRSAPRRIPPRTWSIKSFDFKASQWVEGLLPNTATEYTSPYQKRTYFVQTEGDNALELAKRDAIFAAASLQQVRLARYNAVQRELSTPAAAPLPEPYARAACVAAGRPSILRGDRIVYEHVPPELAAVLLVALGHLPPRFHFCAQDQRRSHK